MQTDYMYMNDVIYVLNEDVKVFFHTVASFKSNDRVYSNCTEFKLNDSESCNTMIKRNLSYYLYIDDRRKSIKPTKLYIYPENMFALLDMFDKAKKTWFEMGANHIYAYLDNSLVITTDESFILKLPLDMVIKIAPGIFKKESGDCMCLNLYLNTPDPVQISVDTFNGLYYSLSRLDMLNYANTALTFMMLRDNPVNRVDYSTDNSTRNQPKLTDSSTTSGSTGRTFNGRNNKSIFD